MKETLTSSGLQSANDKEITASITADRVRQWARTASDWSQRSPWIGIHQCQHRKFVFEIEMEAVKRGKLIESTGIPHVEAQKVQFDEKTQIRKVPAGTRGT